MINSTRTTTHQLNLVAIVSVIINFIALCDSAQAAKKFRLTPPPLIAIPVSDPSDEERILTFLKEIPKLTNVQVEFDAELGRGRFKIAHRGRWTDDLGVLRNVAILSPLALDSCARLELSREAKRWYLASKVDGVHPLLGILELNNDISLVTATAAHSLQHEAHSRTAWNLVSVSKNAVRVFNTLILLHAAGMIHRDLKPGNVLIDSIGNWNLSDFGASRALDEVFGIDSKDSCDMGPDGNATALYSDPKAIKHKRLCLTHQHDQVLQVKAGDFWAGGLTVLVALNGGKNPFIEEDHDYFRLRQLEQDVVNREISTALNQQWPTASPLKCALKELLEAALRVEPDELPEKQNLTKASPPDISTITEDLAVFSPADTSAAQPGPVNWIPAHFEELLETVSKEAERASRVAAEPTTASAPQETP